MEIKQIKITIENSELEKLELTTSEDANLEDWEHVFRIILKWITFGDDTIDKMFGHREWSETPLKDED